MPIDDPSDITRIIRSSLADGRFSQGKELIRAFRADLIPHEVLSEFGDLIEKWGDSLLASGRGQAAILKFELARGIFGQAIGTSGSGEICEGNDMLKRIGRKIETARRIETAKG